MFCPDGIYFVSHFILTLPDDFDRYYKVARVNYDVKPSFDNGVMSAVDKTNMDILMRNVDTGVDYVTTNVDLHDVSEHAIAYFSTEGPFPRHRHLWSFHRTTKRVQKLVQGYSKDPLIFGTSQEDRLIKGDVRAIGAVRIIGAWVYYMIDDTTNKKYELYRVPINATKTYGYRHESTKVIEMKY